MKNLKLLLALPLMLILGACADLDTYAEYDSTGYTSRSYGYSGYHSGYHHGYYSPISRPVRSYSVCSRCHYRTCRCRKPHRNHYSHRSKPVVCDHGHVNRRERADRRQRERTHTRESRPHKTTPPPTRQVANPPRSSQPSTSRSIPAAPASNPNLPIHRRSAVQPRTQSSTPRHRIRSNSGQNSKSQSRAAIRRRLN